MADSCIHEAGHAAMCWYLAYEIHTVTVQPKDGLDGEVGHQNPVFGVGSDPTPGDIDSGKLSQTACHACVMISLAGSEACRIHGDADPTLGAEEDFAKAYDVCERISRSEAEALALYEWLRLRANGILSQQHVWPGVIALAQRLRREPTLSGEVALEAILSAFDAAPAGAVTSADA